MTELKSETQALLELGRSGDDPSEVAIQRNRRQLMLKVGGAALGTAAVTGSTTKALAASSSLKMLTICGALAATGVGLGGYALVQSSAPPSSTRATPAEHAPAAVVERESASTAPAASEAPQVTANTPVAPDSSAFTPTLRNPAAAKSAARTSIQSEIELIRGAQKHLHRGEARAALGLLAEHARRFPGGVLAQERDASRVSALCLAGDVAAARAQAERFLQRSPQSPFAERVKASCAKVER